MQVRFRPQQVGHRHPRFRFDRLIVVSHGAGFDVYLPVAGLIDVDKETERIAFEDEPARGRVGGSCET